MKHIKTFQLYEGQAEKRKTGVPVSYPAAEVLGVLGKIAELNPDIKFMVPDDAFGHASTLLQWPEAKKSLEGRVDMWEKKNDPIKLTIWNIIADKVDYVNSTRLVASGLDKLLDFVKKKGDKVEQLNISMSNNAIRKFGEGMAAGAWGD